MIFSNLSRDIGAKSLIPHISIVRQRDNLGWNYPGIIIYKSKLVIFLAHAGAPVSPYRNAIAIYISRTDVRDFPISRWIMRERACVRTCKWNNNSLWYAWRVVHCALGGACSGGRDETVNGLYLLAGTHYAGVCSNTQQTADINDGGSRLAW
jgi:hypothetical protein